jgi:hypothetical protein
LAHLNPPASRHQAAGKGATRTSLHDLGHLISAGRVRQDPRPPIELEDLSFSAQAFADVDADVQVEADLDIESAIDLSHLPNIRPPGAWSEKDAAIVAASLRNGSDGRK